MPAPKGNKNRVIAKDQRKRGKNMNISMPYEEWEAFRAASEQSEGHTLTEDECLDIWRTIDRQARTAFINANHGFTDPGIIGNGKRIYVIEGDNR